jgi:lipoprotein-anchoring transpeptidase ErfK/SrfK
MPFAPVLREEREASIAAARATKPVQSTSMQRVILAALLASACLAAPAFAQPMSFAPDRQEAAQRARMGGGFIEFLFGGGADSGARHANAPGAERYYQGAPGSADAAAYGGGEPYYAGDPARPAMDPIYLPRTVQYAGTERPGTIIINTKERFLYLVEDGGQALRYGIGVGRPGFTWAGVHHITSKREWPDWRPPDDMLNEPWTIGQAVSSGCIRMRNEDVIDLYGRVKVGTKVVVI